jgi:hypothetical protein
MTIAMHQSSVGVFLPFLRNLSALLDHAAAYAEKRRIDPEVLLRMRLYPNMFDLTRQIGEANRHAVTACALLARRDPPPLAEDHADIAGLKARIAAAIEFIEGLPAEEIDAAADREVVFRFRTGSEQKFSGRSLLLTFSIPNFFFHVTTAYDILRNAGVDLAKKDFLGPPRPA